MTVLNLSGGCPREDRPQTPALLYAARPLLFRAGDLRARAGGGLLSHLAIDWSRQPASRAGRLPHRRGGRSKASSCCATANGHLRAFYNVCQHRAHRLLEGEGRLKSVDHLSLPCLVLRLGRRAARGEQQRPGRRLRQGGVLPGTRSGRGVLRLRLTSISIPDAPSIRHGLADFEREFLSFDAEPERLVRAYHKEIDVRANWKNVIENYAECYHCPQLPSEPVDGGPRHELLSDPACTRPITCTPAATAAPTRATASPPRGRAARISPAGCSGQTWSSNTIRAAS